MTSALCRTAAVIAAGLVLSSGCADSGSPRGPTAPDFQLKDLNDQDVSLSAQRGKVVLLSFWATW